MPRKTNDSLTLPSKGICQPCDLYVQGTSLLHCMNWGKTTFILQRSLVDWGLEGWLQLKNGNTANQIFRSPLSVKEFGWIWTLAKILNNFSRFKVNEKTPSTHKHLLLSTYCWSRIHSLQFDHQETDSQSPSLAPPCLPYPCKVPLLSDIWSPCIAEMVCLSKLRNNLVQMESVSYMIESNTSWYTYINKPRI